MIDHAEDLHSASTKVRTVADYLASPQSNILANIENLCCVQSPRREKKPGEVALQKRSNTARNEDAENNFSLGLHSEGDLSICLSK